MAVEIAMPRLGWTMEEGTLVEWLVKHGDRVGLGEILFTVESDKALSEVESLDEGILHIPDGVPGEGATVPVGTLLGYLLAEGESPPVTVPATSSASEPKPISVPGVEPATEREHPQPASPATARAKTPRYRISPRARRLAEELGVDWRKLCDSRGARRITEDEVRAACGGMQ